MLQLSTHSLRCKVEIAFRLGGRSPSCPSCRLRRSWTAALRHPRIIPLRSGFVGFGCGQQRNVREQATGRVPRHTLVAPPGKMMESSLTSSVRARSPRFTTAALLLLFAELLRSAPPEFPIAGLLHLLRSCLMCICLQLRASFSEVELFWAPLEMQPLNRLAGSYLHEALRNCSCHAPSRWTLASMTQEGIVAVQIRRTCTCRGRPRASLC